jgi:hypothetical protein
MSDYLVVMIGFFVYLLLIIGVVIWTIWQINQLIAEYYGWKIDSWGNYSNPYGEKADLPDFLIVLDQIPDIA